MGRFILIAVFVGGIWYLYSRGTEKPPPPPPPPPPRPAILDQTPPPVLTDNELDKIRLSTKDSDPKVRWAAIELLYRVHDPEAFAILETTLSIDTELEVRRRALEIIRQSDNPAKAKDLVQALKDSEKEIRMAALMALGETGDQSVAPYVADVLRDIEPDVRMEAIHSLGRIQERRNQEFKTQQDLMREEYEKAVRMAKGQPERESGGMFHQMDGAAAELDGAAKKKR